MKLILSNDPSLYSVSIDAIQSSFEAQPLNPPRPTQNHTSLPRIVGSCRGLLCLNFPQCPVLWNPSTRTHHQMPEPEDDADFRQRRNWRRYVVQGLGYDELTDDYKLVRVYQYLGPAHGAHNFDSKVLVYSLKSDSWKRVADFPYFVHFGTMTHAFVNGALHFHVSTKNLSVRGDENVDSDCIIAAFDVSDYTCKVVTRLAVGERKYGLELGVLGGSLSFVRNYEFGVSQCMVMKEYGVNSSWTDLFRVRMNASDRLRFRPITYLGGEDKLVLLEAGGEIFCFDVQTKSFQDFEIHGIDEAFEFFLCVESEVVLGSVDINDKKPQQVKEEVNEENLESEVVLGSLDVNDKIQQQVKEEVNEESLEREVVLGSLDINDKIQQVKEEVNEENLEQVNKQNLESKAVLGSVDGDSCDKMQQANEENLERVSAERDLSAT